jgi:hypothetical protein
LARRPSEARLIALLLVVPLLLDEPTAAARLAELRANFTSRPKQESMAQLARLADEAPDSAAAARGLDWLADLRRGEKDLAGAADAYRRAYAAHDEEAHRLAARGLGDLAIDDGRFVRAGALYREARAGAEGVLAAELELKIALAKKLHQRAMIEWAAWLVVAGALAWFLARSRFWQRPRPELPTEALYVVPVYVLLIGGCVGRDPAVLHALWLCALWSTALIFGAGWAARRRPPVGASRVGHVALLAAANLALFYACCNRAAILDSLFFTVAP